MKFKSFTAFRLNARNNQVVFSLSHLYKNINDLDLFIGGVLEKPVADGLVGPTFRCIVGDQFYRLKRGDRFWYENANQPGSFSAAQLGEIKKATLSRVMCDNSDDSRDMSVQKAAFRVPNSQNPRHNCQDNNIPRMNLAMWEEK